ncbi:MAG: hypothetical protein J0L70_03115 [Leptolyngbya sp. UWPOB_LEPTO1]|uniref:plasmid replication protein, CyRepA1 family n=1 Tax=Leptolyngbya sp. UWPOB_LEPTO1 TaxID=2815653 RepID=UPI001ACEE835|nr:plasmid replication protein, CyRepA1 family [Leptolyngbya sp. UWPOB_LEPTO1]MBN8559493.1 hypothetical protein [Leptolyngbya sp. UWPOB_LEPTO1]
MSDMNSVAQKFLSYFLHVDECVHLRAYKKTEDGKTKGINKTYKKNSINWTELDKLNQDGYNIAFVVNSQGHKSSDITMGTTVFFEYDYDKDGNTIPLEVQMEMLGKLGLPEPTVIIFTGNKSLQFHYCFDLPTNIDDRNRLQADLLEYADADRSLTDASRCMRLPGFKHPATGNMAVIYGGCGKRYLYHELRELVPELTPHTKQITLDVDTCFEDAEDRLQELNLLGYRTESEQVTEALNKLRETQPGSRHHTLVDTSHYLGALCVETGLDMYHVFDQALDAVAHWDNPYKTRHTLQACFLLGLAKGIHNMTTWTLTEPITKHLNPIADFVLEISELDKGKYLLPKHTKLHPHLAIKAPMGTGKTTVMEQVTKQDTSLTITFRTCLVKAIASKFGHASYQDTVTADNQVTTIDSLHKFRGRVFDTVIIDEVSQAVKYLCFSDTDVKHHRLETVEVLRELLTTAKNTYYLDANLDTTTMDFIRGLGIDVKLVHSLYKAPQKRVCYTHNNMTSLLKSLYKDIETGRKVLIMCDTQKMVDTLRKHLELWHSGLRVLSVHGKNSQQTAQQDFINNPVEVFKQYDVVIGSPSIYTGIDINTPDVSRVYLVVKDWGGLTALDNLQAVARARQASEAHVFLYPRKFEAGDTESVLDYEQDLGEKTGQDTIYLRSFFATVEELRQVHNLLTQHTRSILYLYLTEFYGYTLTPASEPTDSDMMQALSYAEHEARQDYINHVLDARELSHEQHAYLQAKVNRGQTLTEAESYEHQRHMVMKLLGRVDEDTVGFYVDRGYEKVLRFSYAFVYNRDMCEFSDILEQKNSLLAYDRSNWTELHDLMSEVTSLCFDETGTPRTFYDVELDLTELRVKYKKLISVLTGRKVPSKDTGLLRNLLRLCGLELRSDHTKLKQEYVNKCYITQESFEFMGSVTGMHKYCWEVVKSVPIKWLDGGTKAQKQLSLSKQKVMQHGLDTGWL